MADRLSPTDVSFLYLEESTTPMHVGSVGVFRPAAEGFGIDTLKDLVRERLELVPRYRQRVRWVPGHLAAPVWADAAEFDLDYHVRLSALPKPGTPRQLRELVGRLMSRPLDTSRPLWEMYLVEGLQDGAVAIVSKTHQALVDGVRAVDIGQVILDTEPVVPESAADPWPPRPEPSALELLAGAAADAIRRPSAVMETVRTASRDVHQTAGRVLGAVGGLVDTLVTAARPTPGSPLNVAIGTGRRFVTVDTKLEDYRQVRAARGSRVNDVVLATIAGALRTWLLTRGVPVRTTTVVRAMVPVSVRDDPAGDPEASDVAAPSEEVVGDTSQADSLGAGAFAFEAPAEADGAAGNLGGRVAAYVVDLPVGEPNPIMRLHQVAYAMKAHQETGRAVGARSLIGLTGFAPPTLHALGAQVAGSLSSRLSNIVVTNVPGPQTPLYAGTAEMLATYPAVPLAKGQALAIGLTSYNGLVCFGLMADRDAMADVEVLAQSIPDALAELVDPG